MISVRELRSAELTDGELASMRSLFRDAWPEPEDRFSRDDWEHTFGGVHFVVSGDDGEVLSHASVVARELEAAGRRLSTGYVEAVATRSSHRRRGFGAAVMRAANAHIDERYELGALGSAQAWFYEPLGWVRWRGPLAVRTDEGEVRTPEEEGYVWIRFTARTPPLDLERTLTCDPRPGDVW